MRPRLLDGFACAGGAGVGYHRAGFDVIGNDLTPFRRYPFFCIPGDFLGLSDEVLDQFGFIHTSPPCQGYTAMRHAPGARGAPRLIGAVREKLQAWEQRADRRGRPRTWIIENVEEARAELRDPLLLCGTMFGLRAGGCELRRHRLFESNAPLTAPCDCRHTDGPVVGVYGGHARVRAARHGGRGTRDAWPDGHRPIAAAAMGMDWASLAEMSEAIPPAYAEHLGRQMLDQLQREDLAA